MADIDTTKNVYLFTHGRQDLIEKSTNALVSNGFSKDKIIMADPAKAGEADDYMAMLWMPPNPDHIKIQKITKVEPAEPTGMMEFGLVFQKKMFLKLKFKKIINHSYLFYQNPWVHLAYQKSSRVLPCLQVSHLDPMYLLFLLSLQ